MHNSILVVAFCLAVCATVRADLAQDAEAIGNQVILQQLFLEEKIRSEGDSGLKQTRVGKIGDRPYQAATATNDRAIASIHEHANNIRTVGMGEFIAVLNGVEFRTRHNDYRLNMPSTTSQDFHAAEPIPFPDVPPEVLQRTTPAAQITEMREWFKAWADQDYSTRDYRKYFKPTLCYLEGQWTNSNGALDEGFDSDRHFIDANTWAELQRKIRFTSFSGRKSINENFAFLPTTIMQMRGSTPVVAQWNYRIMCQPLTRDIPLNRLRVVDDLATRMKDKLTLSQLEKSRAARFSLNAEDDDSWGEGSYRYGFLDELMAEVPGLNNYGAHLIDDFNDEIALEVRPTPGTNGTVNAAYYHRAFKVTGRDAMGQNNARRGYADQNLFMALTTQPKVANMTFEKCTGRRGKRRCKEFNQRWSYAIPLELIYMTPLSEWNPYNIEYKGDVRRSEAAATVTANGRNGKDALDKAFNGTHSKLYYRTPDDFFTGNEVNADDADTSRGTVAVLDRTGGKHAVRATGHRIFLPPIAGVGVLRQRYPIMPLYGDGSQISKELEALKDIVLEPRRNRFALREAPASGGGDDGGDGDGMIVFKTKPSPPLPVGEHFHTVAVSRQEIRDLQEGIVAVLRKSTTTAAGHAHDVEIAARTLANGNAQFFMKKCDGKFRCFDKHPRVLILEL